MKEFFTANGRYNRLKYFGFSLLLSVLAGALQFMLGGMDNSIFLIIYFVIAIASTYASVCITIKRFHDIGKPGIHFLFLFIPLYNIYLALVLLFKKGDDGINAYGPDPLI